MKLRSARYATLLGVALAVLLPSHPGGAAAASPHYWTIKQEGPAQRPVHFDATVSLWVKSVGVGLWYAMPVRAQGLLPGINDSLDLELGGLMFATRDGRTDNDFALAPLGGLRWQFHVTPDWSVFGGLRAGAQFGLDAGGIGARVGTTVGAYWRLTDGLLLRLEAGYPGVLQIGLGFAS